ncbi:hypothetical protein LOZ53_003141 [Ophidiomyces ophidiicola]|nr:hypothetical protein LOZ55_004247 [Ophidiomyces ophidiicola]KAI1990680.1 hypothetical protein LOZ53_003141 [Ophidiomyces ophidiicola]KAI1991317.1 hypothetical protein LOZ54_002194 [Ophidiomyces ophidiicola]KAI1999268.1 hypothetical protein LOZ51_001755 [Ophidiomyces ophidiicola]
MSDNFDKNHSEAVERSAPRRKRGCIGICKRFWWVCLIILVIVVLVVVLPIVFVAYPRLAQRDVNRSTLDVTNMDITNPGPESFRIKLRQVIGTKSAFHPKLDGFPAQVFLDGSSTAFLHLNVPPVKAVNGAVAEIEEDVNIRSANAFTDFALAVMKKDSVGMKISGKTMLKLGALRKTPVNYDKVVTLKGLNGLKGFNVTQFSLILPARADGTNMRGNVFIPNPSVMGLTMGNLTLNLSVDGQPIGQSFMNDVVIRPGDNNIEMTSKVNQTIVIGLIAGQNAKYKNGILPIGIVGESATYNGKNLPYFTEALKSNTLNVELNVGSALGGLTGRKS